MSASLIAWMFFFCIATYLVRRFGQVNDPPGLHLNDEVESPTIVAWISGGRSRVIDTWFIEMQRRGYLKRMGTQADYEIRMPLVLPDDDHTWPFVRDKQDNQDWAFVEAAKAIGDYTRLDRHEIIAKWSNALHLSHEKAINDGWVRDPKRVRWIFAVKTAYFWTATMGTVVGALYLQWPFWIVCIVGTVTLLALSSIPSASWVRLTDHGRARYAQLRQMNRAAMAAPREQDLPMAVAVGSLVVLAGTPWDAWAGPHQNQNQSSSNSGGCGGSPGTGGGCGSSSAFSSSSSGGFSTGGSFGGDGGASSGGGSSGCGGGGCGGGGCGS